MWRSRPEETDTPKPRGSQPHAGKASGRRFPFRRNQRPRFPRSHPAIETEETAEKSAVDSERQAAPEEMNGLGGGAGGAGGGGEEKEKEKEEDGCAQRGTG